jgi:hypothetical protein
MTYLFHLHGHVERFDINNNELLGAIWENAREKKKGRILLNLKPCPYLTIVLTFVFSFTKVEGKVIFKFFSKKKRKTPSHIKMPFCGR